MLRHQNSDSSSRIGCVDRPRLRSAATLSILRPEALPVCGSFLTRLVALNSFTVLPLVLEATSAVPSMWKADVMNLKTRKRAVPVMHPIKPATPIHMYIVCSWVSVKACLGMWCMFQIPRIRLTSKRSSRCSRNGKDAMA